MSLVVTTDVECDHPGCLDWTFGCTGMEKDGKRARRNAAVSGWSRSNRGGVMVDLCPLHGPPVPDTGAEP